MQASIDMPVGLATTTPSSLHRRLVIGVAGALILATMALWELAEIAGPELPGFVSAYQTTVAVCDFLTALMLVSQFVQFRTADLLILSCGYLFTAIIVIVQLASFPGVFAPAGIIGGTVNTAPWLWTVWHSVFPAAVLVYATVQRRVDAPFPRVLANATVLTVGAIVLAYLFSTDDHDFLPPLIAERTFSPFFLGVLYPLMMLLCVAALAALLLVPARYPAINLYLVLAVVGIFLDVINNWHAGARYGLGWYLGRVNSLVGSVSLCVVFVIENALLLRYANRAAAKLRAAKRDADRANDAKSRFLAAVSHDLRQPLAALSLYVGALEGKLRPADVPLLGNMRDSVSHLSEMLSNLLDLSRLEANVITPSVKDFDVNDMLRKIASTFGPEARAKNLALRVGYFARVGRTDPVLYQRMIGNLLANAIRYTKRGGVLVGTRHRDGKLWVEVWDTGIGIPAGRTAEIFEEFKQLGNSERNAAKGSGLGLAIVARTADLLGLQIRVRSQPGKGSMFAIELPGGKSLPPAAKRAFTHRPLRIALVEDNVQVAAALAHALTQHGHEVVAATSCEGVLRCLGGTAPQVVISDYRLAGEENGLGVIARLRSTFGSALPAIIITGDTGPEVMRRISHQGVRVQHKPIDLDVLRMTMAELTASHDERAVAVAAA